MVSTARHMHMLQRRSGETGTPSRSTYARRRISCSNSRGIDMTSRRGELLAAHAARMRSCQPRFHLEAAAALLAPLKAALRGPCGRLTSLAPRLRHLLRGPSSGCLASSRTPRSPGTPSRPRQSCRSRRASSWLRNRGQTVQSSRKSKVANSDGHRSGRAGWEAHHTSSRHDVLVGLDAALPHPIAQQADLESLCRSEARGERQPGSW